MMHHTKIQEKVTRILSAGILAIVSVVAAGGVALADTATTSATSTTGTGTTTYKILVMKHLCNENIHSLADFQALEAGKDPIAALANTVLNCPTTGLVGDAAVAGTVASPRMNYNFQVTQGDGTTSVVKNMNTSGMYMPGKLCETDINKDVDGNGTIASSTCLDISHYEVPFTSSSTMANALFNISETLPPTGFHFGTFRFTPNDLAANNDKDSLVSSDTASGTLNLNLASDTDKTVMLHLYNFRTATTESSTTTGTTGTSTTGMQNSDTMMLLDLINKLQHQIDLLSQQVQSLLAMHHGIHHQGHTMDRDDHNKNTASSSDTMSSMNSTAHVWAASESSVVGDTNDFAGTNFGANEQVTVTMGDTTLMTVTTDNEGNLSTGSIVVPMTVGSATYTFTGMTSGKVASVTVMVIPAP